MEHVLHNNYFISNFTALKKSTLNWGNDAVQGFQSASHNFTVDFIKTNAQKTRDVTSPVVRELVQLSTHLIT